MVEQGMLVMVHVGACGWWWCHHAKGVEWGMLVIVCVGTHQQWWGVGCRLSIMVVVGTCGWHWMVATVN